MRSRIRAGVLAASFIIASCTGSDAPLSTPGTDSSPSAPADASASESTEPADDAEPIANDDALTTLEDVLSAAPIPEVEDAESPLGCERYGYVCDTFEASETQIQEALAALDVVRTAMSDTTDAREQMTLGAAAALGIDGVGHLEVDEANATQFAFTVNDGPKVLALTVAGLLSEDPDIADLVDPVEPTVAVTPPSDDSAQTDDDVTQDKNDNESETVAEGLRGSSLRSGVPERLEAALPALRRYEPSGGAESSRRALLLNPFRWDSVNEIADIFRSEEEYTTVDVMEGTEVTPDVLFAIGSYDAVHVLTHGGGSCPSWTDDRSECASTIVGGEFDTGVYEQIKQDIEDQRTEAGASSEAFPGVSWWMCESGGVTRYCFNSDGFPANPNGITFVGACGSDFGFGGSNGSGGATVTWTGTSQRPVVERTAAEFWRLMVEDGVEFELASQAIQDGGYDDHKLTFWASGGDVNMFTSAAFSGRNLRARDVVDAAFEGDPLLGQAAKVSGSPGDGADETFPTDGQKLTIDVQGVRTGTESDVTIEFRGDGEAWASDIDLVRDGTIIAQGDGFATWRVDVSEKAITVPSLNLSDLTASAPPTEIEIRVFETRSEFTAVSGTLRFGADVVANGPIPIFTELTAGLPAGGEVLGNDLAVSFNTAGGDLTGELRVELLGQGISVGVWTIDLAGTYDATTGTIVADVSGTAQSTVPGFTDIGDSGEGGAEGSVNLEAGTVNLSLGYGGATQQYVGTIGIS